MGAKKFGVTSLRGALIVDQVNPGIFAFATNILIQDRNKGAQFSGGVVSSSPGTGWYDTEPSLKNFNALGFVSVRNGKPFETHLFRINKYTKQQWQQAVQQVNQDFAALGQQRAKIADLYTAEGRANAVQSPGSQLQTSYIESVDDDEDAEDMFDLDKKL